jgi:hypothetical protein
VRKFKLHAPARQVRNVQVRPPHNECADGIRGRKFSGVHAALGADDRVLVKLQVVAPTLDFGAEVLAADGVTARFAQNGTLSRGPCFSEAFANEGG